MGWGVGRIVLAADTSPRAPSGVLIQALQSVDVQADSLFEAVAAAIVVFRQEAWAAQALTPTAVLRVEVQLPPVIHEVPLKAVERWAAGPSVSPKEELAKRRVR